jgi:PhoH-like ATPase
MWNGEHLEEVKVKPITNKYLGAKDKIIPFDIYQKAFIHMLQNDVVKIKITDSIYGAGKSFLMIHWALQMLEKGDKFNKLYFVKSDSPPKNRKPFPAVPGGVNEKCELLMGVLCDVTSEDNLTDILIRNNKLEILPIQSAKGRSLKRSILYINECQDFTPSEIERLLSRVGEDTFVLLDGSTKQIDNRYCSNRNGLTVASLNFRDKPNSAQVNMIEDYRSELSKMVSQMDWHD